MNARLRNLLALLLLSYMAAAPAAINYQDMWWRPSESGWGLMVMNQGDVVSAVMFHYRPDRTPTWYLLSNASRASGEVFTGTLYETSGPPLFGAFDPNAVATRNVGTMTLRFATSRAGRVEYVIDGQSAGKDIERITFQTPELNGDYLGSQSGYASCPGFATIDTYTFSARTSVSGSAAAPQIQVELGSSLLGESLVCVFAGDLLQSGAVHSGQGVWTCRNSTNQIRQTANYVIDELRLIDRTIVINFHATASYPSVNATCTERGTFTGVKR